MAADDLDVALDQRNSNCTADDIFYALQNLLNAAANISKALWGSRGKYRGERKELRDSIGVEDASPLFAVTMRNHYEHFDERLDRWWNESKGPQYVDLNVSSRSDISVVDKNNWFRNFDRKTRQLTFWEDDFDIQGIIEEVRRILPKVQEEADKSPWEEVGTG
jgi:hypothetical protein